MVIFLVLVLYLASLVVMLIRGEARGHKFQQSTSNARFGAQNGGFVLLGISLLLLIRQAYSTATASDRSRANNEHLWYPLIALPEILIVMLFYIPDLIPRRSELICGEEAAMSVKPGNLYSEPTPLPSARVESRLRSKTISRQGPPPFTPSTPQLPPDHDLVADSKIEQEQNGSMDRAPSVPLERTPSRLT
ncbi:hypothetical protein H0H93_012547 [Arthromyces matolae]|nr:hypothetical protein H0H93_012547 [Arthromyces matolae]